MEAGEFWAQFCLTIVTCTKTHRGSWCIQGHPCWAMIFSQHTVKCHPTQRNWARASALGKWFLPELGFGDRRGDEYWAPDGFGSGMLCCLGIRTASREAVKHFFWGLPRNVVHGKEYMLKWSLFLHENSFVGGIWESVVVLSPQHSLHVPKPLVQCLKQDCGQCCVSHYVFY